MKRAEAQVILDQITDIYVLMEENRLAGGSWTVEAKALQRSLSDEIDRLDLLLEEAGVEINDEGWDVNSLAE